MKIGVTLIAALIFAAAAAAGTPPPVPWSKKDMVAAVRAIGYPKPHPRALTCKPVGPAFRCTAIYTRKRVFYTEGRGLGGWICAGAKLATCKVLRHGFMRQANIGTGELAARGYMTDRYGILAPVVASRCTQTGATAWACGYYATDTTVATVTITMKKAPGGYTTAASVSTASTQ